MGQSISQNSEVNPISDSNDPLIYAIKEKYIDLYEKNKDKIFNTNEQEISDDDVMKQVIKNGLNIRFVEDPPLDLCKLAVQQNIYSYVFIIDENIRKLLHRVLLSKDGMLLKYIDEPTDELCFQAVKQNGLALQFVKNQTEKLCYHAVKQNGLALEFVNREFVEKKLNLSSLEKYNVYGNTNSDDEVILWKIAISENPLAFQFIENKTDEVIDEVYELIHPCGSRDYSLLLKFIDTQTESLCKKFIEKVPKSFMHIKEQTEKICEYAIQIDGKIIQYVNDEFKTNDLLKKAVRQDGLALEFIENKTDELCEIAVLQNPLAIQFVKNQTEELCLKMLKKLPVYSVKQNAFSDYDMIVNVRYGGGYESTENSKKIKNILKYITTQTPLICEAALKFNGLMLDIVENKTEYLCIIAIEQNILSFQSVDEQTEDLCMFVLSQLYKKKSAFGYVKLADKHHESKYSNADIIYSAIKNKTPKICKYALEHDSMFIKYVPEQTEELCLQAVMQNGLALRHVEIPTRKIMLEAVRQNGAALIYTNPYNKNKNPYSMDMQDIDLSGADIMCPEDWDERSKVRLYDNTRAFGNQSADASH
jgi:Domain of unknown function (DUF4116)